MKSQKLVDRWMEREEEGEREREKSEHTNWEYI